MNFACVVVMCVALLVPAFGYAAQPVSPTWLHQPEMLRYKVAWGPLNMGKAMLAYTPGPVGKHGVPYTLTIQAKDSVQLIELHNRYTTTGVHGTALFTAQRHQATQNENAYRADKTLVFDRNTITYTNNLDANDTMPPLQRQGMNDVFSTIYRLRAEGLAAIQGGGRVPTLGMKRPFDLTWPALTRRTERTAWGEEKLWRVQLSAVHAGKPAKDSWVVYLRHDPQLTPVLIVANLKFGSFRATLLK